MDVNNLTPEQQEAMAEYEKVHGDAPVEEEHPEDEVEVPSEIPEEEGEIPSEIPDEDEGGEGELLLGKFKSQEALMEAYKNLEAKLGQKPQEGLEDPLEAPEAKEEKPTAEVNDLDMTAFKAEVFKAGKLSDESVKALEKANVPKAFIESFVASELANKENTAKEVYEIAGSKEAYGDLLNWAKGLDAESKVYYNSQLNSGNPIMIKNAVKALNALRQTSGEVEKGSESPVRITGKKPAVSGKTYTSYSELEKDMSDPRWQTDKAYTAKVTAKAARSNI